LQLSDRVPALDFRQSRAIGEMALESKLIECLIVERTKFQGQPAQRPDKSELRGDLANHETEPNLLHKLQTTSRLFEEGSYTRCNNGVEHHFDVVGHDIVDASAVFYLVEGIILLKNHLAAILLDELAGVPIEDVWPDVICGRERKALAAVLY
jgi:hypothetical protein